MPLGMLLERVEAPQALRDWLAKPRRVDPWASCSRGDWLIWLAACSGHPLATVLQASCDCVERAVDAMPQGTATLRRALEVSREASSAEACAAAAVDCEAARREYPASYRAPIATGYRAASLAACWAARAAEGLVTAEARAEVRSVTDARARAMVIGMNPYIMPAQRTGPARLDPAVGPDDPVQQELAFVVAAAAQAVEQAARALGPGQADASARKQAHTSFADLVRRRLGAPGPLERRATE